MDLYTAHAGWLENTPAQSQPPPADQRNGQQSPTNVGHYDDWRAGAGSGSGGPALSHEIDFGLDDPSAGAQPTSASPPPNAYYYPYAYVTPGQHTAYSPNVWPPPSTSTLSSYSSLNGAISPPPAQPPSQPADSHMVIDPALTALPGTSNGHYAHSISPPPPAPSHSPDPTPHAAHYPYMMNSGMQYFDPRSAAAFAQLYAMNVRPPQQQQPIGQGSLSPSALHPSTTLSSLPPSSFYNSAPSTPTSATPVPQTASLPLPQQEPIPQPAKPQESPEARKERLSRTLKPLLTPNSFSGAGAVVRLVDVIDDFDGAGAIDVSTRLELLTKIRDNAPNHYFRAWSENEEAMEITREWLKAGITGKADQATETIMPLLHIIDRLPLTVDGLKNSKLGKLVVKLVKEPPAPAIKDMAANIERRWRLLVEAKKDGEDGTQDAKAKKRKPTEPAPSKAAGPPAKKQATGAGAKSATPSVPARAAATVKKEQKAVPGTPAVKDAKSDSSFFSAPKPKPKLPAFKRTPGGALPGTNVAQPSAIDPFQEVLTAMKARKASPVTVAPTPPPNAAAVAAAAAGLTRSGKKKKSVRWRPDGESDAPGMLSQFKLIERAVYDDDPKDGNYPMHDIRDLERAEGAALHAHQPFEELVDWSEPVVLEIPPMPLEPPERGNASAEKHAQDAREQAALSALYISRAQIPDSAAEPPAVLPPDEVDKEVVHMQTGPEADAVFWAESPDMHDGVPPPAPPPGPPPAQAQALQDIMSALGGGQGGPNAPPLVPDQNQLASILAQLQHVGMPPPPQHGQPAPHQEYMPPAPQGAYYGAGNEPHWQNQNQYQQQGYQPPQQGGWDAGAGRGAPGGWQHQQQPGGAGPSGDGFGARGGRGGAGGGFGRGRGRGGYGSKRIPCKFYAQGSCRKGEACEFAHDGPPAGY